MKNINAFDHAETILKVLAKGAFLTTAADGKQNTMTIGWGALGNIWGKPVFTVMVRQSPLHPPADRGQQRVYCKFAANGRICQSPGTMRHQIGPRYG